MLTSKTTWTLGLFCAVALCAYWVPSPFRSGALLDVAPDVAGMPTWRSRLFLDPQGELTGPEVVPVELPPPRDQVSDGPGDRADPRPAQVLAMVEELVGQLGPDPQPIDRPCTDEGPQGCRRRMLDAFYEAMYRTAIGELDRPARYTQLGDSLTGWEHFTSELRRLLQAQFGDGGHGWIYASDPGNGVGADDVHWSHAGWEPRTIPFSHDRVWGPSGATFRQQGTGFTRIRTTDEGLGSTMSRIAPMLYAPGPTRFTLTVGGERRTIDTAGDLYMDWIELEPGPQDLTLSGFAADVVAHGAIVETDRGVVVDNLGLVSARMDQLLKLDPEYWEKQLRFRDADVVSFFYGAVSAQKEPWHHHTPSEEWVREYRAQYGEVLQRLRDAIPDQDCLAISVLTRAYPKGATMAVFPSVPVTMRAQRAEAADRGCAFWSSFDAIGGLEGADAWYRHRPRLLGLDLRHPTRDGYRELARRFYASLMHGFREWLTERAAGDT